MLPSGASGVPCGVSTTTGGGVAAPMRRMIICCLRRRRAVGRPGVNRRGLTMAPASSADSEARDPQRLPEVGTSRGLSAVESRRPTRSHSDRARDPLFRQFRFQAPRDQDLANLADRILRGDRYRFLASCCVIVLPPRANSSRSMFTSIDSFICSKSIPSCCQNPESSATSTARFRFGRCAHTAQC